MDWRPIDDEIVTKIHEKFYILPCAFPHDEYLKQYNVQPAKESFVKYNKVNTEKKMLKICPQDDTKQIIERMQTKHKEHEEQLRVKENARKQHKKANYRARRNARRNAISTEARETESTKQLIIETMDEYNSVTGNPPQQAESSIPTHSVATRMRTRSTSKNSPEKQNP